MSFYEFGRCLPQGRWRSLLGFANDCQTVGAALCAVFAGCAFRMTAIKFVFVPVSFGNRVISVVDLQRSTEPDLLAQTKSNLRKRSHRYRPHAPCEHRAECGTHS